MQCQHATMQGKLRTNLAQGIMRFIEALINEPLNKYFVHISIKQKKIKFNILHVVISRDVYKISIRLDAFV